MTVMNSPVPHVVKQFLRALRDAGYRGDGSGDYADRLVLATDNSLYQMMPQAVLYPADARDIELILGLAQEDRFSFIAFTPRGGGTGTNGQSLNDTVVIDTSRHMTRILDINADQGWVRIEPGLVPDRLNEALKPLGLCFPIDISPSKSATIGGMVSTDACGKGSRVYGKTADYILKLRGVFADGQAFDTSSYEDTGLTAIIAPEYAHACANTPHLPRGLSGYNIPQSYDPTTGRLDINRLLSGSEGSLAVLSEVTLRIVPRPMHKTMFVLAYADFDTALRHVAALLSSDPVAIESIDDHVIALGRRDVLWHEVKDALSDLPDEAQALHFVEFEAFSEEELHNRAKHFKDFLADDHVAIRHYHVNGAQREAIVGIRKKCVGLLGNMDGNRRPLPFIEDTAVPPERLADYIADLRALLTEKGLVCGMFGHSDAGCLHVRPALDMRLPEDRGQIRGITEAVVELLKKHGGVLWGEHGKGMRGAYTQVLAGTAYYALMQKIKAHFDPMNRLNPGKIAADPGALNAVDEAPMRGDADRQIEPSLQETFPKATQCNGNGMCFSAMPDDSMCPSYKATGDRVHSPKGRAALLREWMRLESIDKERAAALSHDVKNALHGCLSCKACTSTCPIHVNIPQMKSDFLGLYYSRKMRPLRDYLIAFSERLLPFQAFVPQLVFAILGLKDAPRRAGKNLRAQMREHGYKNANDDTIACAVNPVLIVHDNYTAHYEPDMVMAALSLIRKLGFEPLSIFIADSGKGSHVKGFTKRFNRIVNRNAAYLESLAGHNLPMIGIDPSMTLLYRDEYRHALKRAPLYTVTLLQEWLAALDLPCRESGLSYSLLQHCTEKTMLPGSGQQWRDVFAALGVELNILNAGCCGMAGAYGHEGEHRDLSRRLYDLSWRDKMDPMTLATGFSCREQAGRFDVHKPRHPVEILNELL